MRSTSDIDTSKLYLIHYHIIININIIKSSSCLEVLCKKSVLKIFAKFKGKHQCRILLLNKFAGERLVSFIKKETLALVFSCELCEFFRAAFYIEQRRWLLQYTEFLTHFITFFVLLNNSTMDSKYFVLPN